MHKVSGVRRTQGHSINFSFHLNGRILTTVNVDDLIDGGTFNDQVLIMFEEFLKENKG